MRWSTADSSVGATTTHSASPTIVPTTAAIVPTSGAVGQQHEPQVLVGGADRGEHAELAQPPLRDDREAGGGDQRGQEQEHGGHGERGQRLRRPVARPRSSEPASADVPRRSARQKESIDRSLASDQDRDVRPARRADDGETSANSSSSSRGFSTMPTTVRRRPSSASVAAQLEPEEVGDAVGDRDLAGADRVAAAAEREQRAAVGAVRVLRAEVDGLDAAGDGDRAMADDVDRAERRRAAASPASSLRGSEPSNLEQVVGRAELARRPAGPRCGRS